jgi:poly(A) polymerase
MSNIVDIELNFASCELDRIISALQVNKEETRIVGGAIRDKLMGEDPKDIDLITTISPKDVVKILRAAGIAVIPTGIKFGTFTAYVEGKGFEITTLREDLECDGRRAKVAFTRDFLKDAQRRDFTINAMSYDSINRKLYDYFDGYEDLKNNIVKFIGDPVQRIQEDHLRILRFFRFSAKYSSSLNNDGLVACIAQKERIKFLSPERIISEFNKILSSEGSVKILEIMQKNQILHEISQDLKWDIESYKVFVDGMSEEFKSCLPKIELRYVTLLNKNSWELLHSELFRLRLSNREIRKVYYLKYYEDMLTQGVDLAYLLKLVIYDQKAELLSFLAYIMSVSKIARDQALDFLQRYKNYFGKILPINGEDLKHRFSGIEIGDKLKEAKDLWIESDFTLSKQELIKRIS